MWSISRRGKRRPAHEHDTGAAPSRGPATRRRAVLAAALAPFAVAALGVLAFLVVDWLFPFPEAKLRRPYSTVITDAADRPLRIFLAADDHYRLPVRFDEVSPELVQALLGSEDRWFHWHPGVNPFAIARAALANLRAGRVVSGASTIPMQIARMVEPKPRTLRGKLLEALRALQLDLHHSKRELLEIYLNLAPYGGNLQGVGAASYFYFGKTPAQLSLGEAALLTALPRSPALYDPTRHPVAALAARNRVLEQLGDLGVFPAAALARSRHQEVPRALRPAPFLAPHFSEYAYARVKVGTRRARTTIDLRVQGAVERHIESHVPSLRRQGLDSAAAVVIDNETRALRAMVGSADFFDAARQGQVNAAVARRSPGSTLKPFLYAQAIDAGIIVPSSYLLDVPTDFSGYIAQNYDGEYRGRITAAEALRLSLNAAAVRLLAELGLRRFHETLVRAGALPADRTALSYGLPLVLGAAEVRLLDLTNLYATLANGGVHRPVRIWEEPPREAPAGTIRRVSLEPEAPIAAAAAMVAGPAREAPAAAVRLLSAEAAALIAEILAEVERPDMPKAWELTRDVPGVAWKTGTSFGHRDAWAVGFSPRYTIGVWVGNPDGRGQEGISGSLHAGPLLFDLFRALDPGAPGPTRDERLRLVETEVCEESHELAGAFCPRRTTVTTVAGVSRLGACPVHRRVFLDAESGDLLAGDCLRERPHHPAILSIYPAELTAWQRARGQHVAALPPLSPACRGIPSDNPPRIVSPDANTPYLVRRSAPLEHQKIPLVARAADGADRFYWYQDGLLVASGQPETGLFLAPEIGTHRLVVVDGKGRMDAITYEVR
jgi:penicillin-binding protein 1C